MFGEEDLIKIHRNRASQIATILFICFGIVLLRLWYLQIFQGEIYHAYSINNRLRKEIVWAPRGQIFSADNELLVDNVPRYDAIVTPQYLSDKENTLKILADILEMDVKEINKIILKNSGQAKYRPIIIKKNISLTELARIETENEFLPGISVDIFISREYRDKEVGAHLFGYISEINSEQLPKYRNAKNGIDYRLGDFIGQSGLEQEMDDSLRGENGHIYVEVDALGRKKKYINTDNLFKGIQNQPAVPGNNLFLTVDRDLQLAAYEALKDQTGGAVAIDIKTGAILAMVSTPSFNPSNFSKGISNNYWSELINNPENPLRDRTIQEHFSPGSTFKPFTAITGLTQNIVDANSKIRCHGTFQLGSRTYHSWKRYGSEKVTVVDALKQSCNIYFYKVASEMKIDDLADISKQFGFGKRSGIALPREASGLIPTESWKQKRFGIPWQLGETLSCSIGQSYMLVTIIQLAMAYSAIANKGKLWKPYVVNKVTNYKGEVVEEFKPELIRELNFDNKIWNLIQEGLYKVANEPGGTAFYRRGLGNQMSGKTGTSQVVKAASADKLYSKCIEMPYELRHHGVFVGYAPKYDPRIAVASLVEHGCAGSSSAAPVAEKIISKFMQKNYPDEVEENTKKEKAQWAKIALIRKKAQEEAEEAEQSLEASESTDNNTKKEDSTLSE